MFISDQHLGLQTKEIEDKKERKLVAFLKFAEENCDELFMLGDLFDYWFEYKSRMFLKRELRFITLSVIMIFFIKIFLQKKLVPRFITIPSI